MKRYLSFLLISNVLAYAHSVDWNYTNVKDWGNINPLYLGCAQGNQQSPINIVTKKVMPGAIDFQLQYIAAKGINLTLSNGTFKISYPKGSFLLMNGNRYELKEIYLKTPTENAIDSLHTPLEAQFLHEDSRGNKVMLSVFFVDGKANPIFEQIVKNLPSIPNQSNFITNIDINKLIPNTLGSYQFDGSMTIPPCSQGVRWIILKQAMNIAPNQINAITQITKDNVRNLQDVSNRLIVEN